MSPSTNRRRPPKGEEKGGIGDARKACPGERLLFGKLEEVTTQRESETTASRITNKSEFFWGIPEFDEAHVSVEFFWGYRGEGAFYGWIGPQQPVLGDGDAFGGWAVVEVTFLDPQ